MWKHIAANALTVIIVALVALGGAVTWVQNQYRTDGPLETAVCLRVESGSNMKRVSEDLVSMGAVSSGAIFRVGVDYQDKSHLLKAGSFLIEPGTSMEAIVDQITTSGRSTCGSEVNFRIGLRRVDVALRTLNPQTGRFETMASYIPGEEPVPEAYSEARKEDDLRLRVTLAEGLTSWQIVEGLKQAEFLTGEITEVPPEGTLAPDSYEVRPGSERADVLARMQAAQADILDTAWAARIEGLPISTPQEVLIMASIIEKETSVAEERRTIAQVFMNRLSRGMRLQFDPTIIYGITRGEGVFEGPIRQSDKEGRTEARLHGKIEFNTYEIDGLPPTPIANPGRAAIEAAVNPDGSDYIFFVADGSGGHAFAATLEEHNANVAKWRAIEAERSNN